MKHDLYERDDDLAHCKVCGGAEGTLPTDCPGERMGEAREKMVYAGQLDYRAGQWWAPIRMPDDATCVMGKWWAPVRRMSVGDTHFEGWLSTSIPSRPAAFSYNKQDMRDAYAAGHEEGLCTWPRPWDEARERAKFEDACYRHYLEVRERRAGHGVYGVLDGPVPHPRESLFTRTAVGDYVAIVYQQAWGGWKLARGG